MVDTRIQVNNSYAEQKKKLREKTPGLLSFSTHSVHCITLTYLFASNFSEEFLPIFTYLPTTWKNEGKLHKKLCLVHSNKRSGIQFQIFIWSPCKRYSVYESYAANIRLHSNVIPIALNKLEKPYVYCNYKKNP